MPGRGCFDALMPFRADAFPACFAYPADFANAGIAEPTAWPTGVEPKTATTSAVADSTSGRRLIGTLLVSLSGGSRRPYDGASPGETTDGPSL